MNMKTSTLVGPTRRDVVVRLIAPAAALVAVWALPVSTARAHSEKAHAKNGLPRKEQLDWGIAGDARNSRRIIEVGMADNMRFTPERIEVGRGDTV